MQSLAYFRLPYADTYTRVSSDRTPVTVGDLKDVGSMQGFVFAPFCADEVHPVVLILPDEVTTHSCLVQKEVLKSSSADACQSIDRQQPDADYADDFKLFHSQIVQGNYEKLVLARSRHIDTEFENVESLFHKACAIYPRAMVILVSTPLTGTWLIATPEVLLDCEHDRWRTMALAGTMQYTEGLPEWSVKNQKEQHIVEEYVGAAIAPYADNVIKDGPQTVRAANLIHLCTTFRFRLKPEATIGDVVSSLHPTPAVCGLPKDDALHFILTNEHCQREYYSGFSGPVGLCGGTHLYVSLRCVKLNRHDCTLYAGGGIVADSVLDDEWAETERKMGTIGRVVKE